MVFDGAKASVSEPQRSRTPSRRELKQRVRSVPLVCYHTIPRRSDMPRDDESTPFQTVLQLLVDEGFDGFATALEILVNEAMKLAAAHAIAHTIPDGAVSEDYIVPSLFDKTVVPNVALAVAAAEALLGLVGAGVRRKRVEGRSHRRISRRAESEAHRSRGRPTPSSAPRWSSSCRGPRDRSFRRSRAAYCARTLPWPLSNPAAGWLMETGDTALENPLPSRALLMPSPSQ